MKREKKIVDFQLSQSLKYARKGEQEETATIMMHAPSMEVFDEESSLAQLVMGAFADAQRLSGSLSPDQIREARENAESEEMMDAESIRMMLYASQNVKFTEIAGAFKRLAVKVCFLADDVKMTNSMFDKMDLDDFKGLVCSYIANFITPSLLPAQGG